MTRELPCPETCRSTPGKTHPLAVREIRTAFNYALTAKGIPAKVCSRCLVIKPHSAFHRFSSSSDGLRSFCRACFMANHARRHATDPEYREKYRAQSRAWHAKNYAANPEKVRAVVKARHARYAIANANRVQDPNVMKRCNGPCGRTLPETHFWLDRWQRDGLRKRCRECHTRYQRRTCWRAHGAPDGQLCYLCGEIIPSAADAHADHVIPRSMGGSDKPDNLRWVHSACNLQRKADPLTLEQLLTLLHDHAEREAKAKRSSKRKRAAVRPQRTTEAERSAA